MYVCDNCKKEIRKTDHAPKFQVFIGTDLINGDLCGEHSCSVACAVALTRKALDVYEKEHAK